MPKLSVLELGGCESPKAGNDLQEVCVCVCMKWGTVVALFGLAAGIIFFLFFCFGCRACAWTGTAPGVLGHPSHPPSSYHPKGGLIGILELGGCEEPQGGTYSTRGVCA